MTGLQAQSRLFVTRNQFLAVENARRPGCVRSMGMNSSTVQSIGTNFVSQESWTGCDSTQPIRCICRLSDFKTCGDLLTEPLPWPDSQRPTFADDRYARGERPSVPKGWVRSCFLASWLPSRTVRVCGHRCDGMAHDRVLQGFSRAPYAFLCRTF